MDAEYKSQMPGEMIMGLEAIICASMNTNSFAQIEIMVGDKRVRVIACPMDHGVELFGDRTIIVPDHIGEMKEIEK